MSGSSRGRAPRQGGDRGRSALGAEVLRPAPSVVEIAQLRHSPGKVVPASAPPEASRKSVARLADRRASAQSLSAGDRADTCCGEKRDGFAFQASFSSFADDASLRSLISFESGSYLTSPSTWRSLLLCPTILTTPNCSRASCPCCCSNYSGSWRSGVGRRNLGGRAHDAPGTPGR